MPTNSDRSYRFPQVAQSTVKRIANRALLGASSFLVLLVAMVLTAPGREGGQPDRASAPNGTVEPPIRHQQWRLDVLRIRQTDTVGDPPVNKQAQPQKTFAVVLLAIANRGSEAAALPGSLKLADAQGRTYTGRGTGAAFAGDYNAERAITSACWPLTKFPKTPNPAS